MKKAFTLIEVLGVIVVLGIVVAITTPIINHLIEEYRRGVFKQSVHGVFDAVEIYKTENREEQLVGIIDVTDPRLSLSNDKMIFGYIYEDNDVYVVSITDGTYCATGYEKDFIISKEDCGGYTYNKNIQVDIAATSSIKSITVTATTTGANSNIKGYQFSIDEGLTWTDMQDSNIYTFTGLDMDTEYTVMVKSFTENNEFGLSDKLTIKTLFVPEIVFSGIESGWQQEKSAAIDFPQVEGTVSKYFIEVTDTTTTTPSIHPEGQWIIVTEDTDLTVFRNSIIHARVEDLEGNLIHTTSIPIIEVDSTVPTIGTFIIESQTKNTGYTYYALLNKSNTFTDIHSGLTKVEYCFKTNSATNCTTYTNVLGNNIVNNFEETFNYATKKEGQILCVRAEDQAGNITTKCDTTSYLVDSTKPNKVANGTITKSTSGSSHYVHVSATNSFTDNESNIKYRYYSLNSTTGFTTSTTLAASCGTTYNVYSYTINNAGIRSNTEIIGSIRTNDCCTAPSGSCTAGSASQTCNGITYTCSPGSVVVNYSYWDTSSGQNTRYGSTYNYRNNYWGSGWSNDTGAGAIYCSSNGWQFNAGGAHGVSGRNSNYLTVSGSYIYNPGADNIYNHYATCRYSAYTPYTWRAN